MCDGSCPGHDRDDRRESSKNLQPIAIPAAPVAPKSLNKEKMTELMKVVEKSVKETPLSLRPNIEKQLAYFSYGFSNVVPPEWEKFLPMLDDEFKEYTRLKAKFEK